MVNLLENFRSLLKNNHSEPFRDFFMFAMLSHLHFIQYKNTSVWIQIFKQNRTVILLSTGKNVNCSFEDICVTMNVCNSTSDIIIVIFKGSSGGGFVPVKASAQVLFLIVLWVMNVIRTDELSCYIRHNENSLRSSKVSKKLNKSSLMD